MVRVKDIIISESAPNDPKVGWITISNGKPVLRFNINGVWKDMTEKTDNPGEDVDNYYRILVDPAGGLWLLSIYGDADLNNDEQTTDMTVVCFSTEESLMRWRFVAGYTVGQYKALTGETISNEIDFDDKHQFPYQTVWCSAAAEALNVTINTDGREKSSVMSGVSYLACKPDVKTINLTAGANISIFPSGPLSLTGSGNKLVQFTFVKTSEGIAYEVYVSKLGEDF